MLKLQNRAARVITFQGYDTRSVDILEELNWNNLSLRRDKHLCLMVYNALNRKVLGYLRELFIKCSDHIPYSSRFRNSEINLAMTYIEVYKCGILFHMILKHHNHQVFPKINCHYGRIVIECLVYVHNLFLFIKFNIRKIKIFLVLYDVYI